MGEPGPPPPRLPKRSRRARARDFVVRHAPERFARLLPTHATSPDSADLRALPPYYGGTITAEELNSPRLEPSAFSSSELAETGSVRRYFASRRAILDSSRPDRVPGYVRFGSANWPHFGDEFVADWREFLPHDHAQRRVGPPLVVSGSADANNTLLAAHRAIRTAMADVARNRIA